MKAVFSRQIRLAFRALRSHTEKKGGTMMESEPPSLPPPPPI